MEMKKPSPTKGKEECPERMLHEIEGCKLSETEFKIMVIRTLKELSETTRNFVEATRNLMGIILAWERT